MENVNTTFAIESLPVDFIRGNIYSPSYHFSLFSGHLIYSHLLGLCNDNFKKLEANMQMPFMAYQRLTEEQNGYKRSTQQRKSQSFYRC